MLYVMQMVFFYLVLLPLTCSFLLMWQSLTLPARVFLCFNPSKSTCVSYGWNTFVKQPIWTISNIPIPIKSSLSYLVAQLCYYIGVMLNSRSALLIEIFISYRRLVCATKVSVLTLVASYLIWVLILFYLMVVSWFIYWWEHWGLSIALKVNLRPDWYWGSHLIISLWCVLLRHSLLNFFSVFDFYHSLLLTCKNLPGPLLE